MNERDMRPCDPNPCPVCGEVGHEVINQFRACPRVPKGQAMVFSPDTWKVTRLPDLHVAPKTTLRPHERAVPMAQGIELNDDLDSVFVHVRVGGEVFAVGMSGEFLAYHGLAIVRRSRMTDPKLRMQLADKLQAAEDDNRELLAENARLRRRLEKLERKR